MKCIVPKVLQNNSIQASFTGILIVKQYSSAVSSNIMFVFKDGEVIDFLKNLYDYYLNKELDNYIVKWIESNKYDSLEVYTDPYNVISEFDFLNLIGEPFKLNINMNCVKS